MKRILIPVIMIIALMFAVSAVCADDLADVKKDGVLRFGAPLEYVPFVFEDESGNTTGMDIALMEEICRRIGVRLEKTSFARDGIIDALNIGQIDVIGGGLSKTDSRAERIDFTRTYYNGEAQVIALASLPKPDVVNLDSFRGMKVGVVKGSSFQEWVMDNLVEKEYIPIKNVYTYSDIVDGMKALDRKDVDLVLTDQDVYEDRYRATGKYQLFYTGFHTENYAFGVRKGSTLAQEISNHLNDMMKDGTAQSIANRFFSMDFSSKYNEAISRPAATLVPVVPTVSAPVQTAKCVNAMSYVADVTVKDGSAYNPGAGFRKTWRIYNNGSCTWDNNYYLDYAGGDRMNGSSARIPTIVKPGQTVDVSIDMTAPNYGGNYKGYWQMRSPQGQGFGQTIWVSIRVSGNYVQPTAVPRQDGQVRTIPSIDYFYADSDSGKPGDGTTVHWSTTRAGGVTLYVDNYLIENSSASGSYSLQAPLQGRGTHEIKLVAHSVTDDVSASIWYTMKDESGWDGEGQKQITPVIDYFYADSNSGYSGDGTTIHWGTSNAGGVTIYVDGYQIDNGSASGSLGLQAPLQGTGTHTITLVAHSVTDDASTSITYTMYERESYGGGSSSNDYSYSNNSSTDTSYPDDIFDMTEQQFSDAIDSMTDDDWNQLFESMTEEDWSDLFEMMTDEEIAEMFGD